MSLNKKHVLKHGALCALIPYGIIVVHLINFKNNVLPSKEAMNFLEFPFIKLFCADNQLESVRRKPCRIHPPREVFRQLPRFQVIIWV